MNYINPILYTDAYKLSHIHMTSKGVETIYSNFTPRFDKYLKAKFKSYDGKVVWFGMQYALKKVLYEVFQKGFFDKPKNEVINEAKSFLEPYIGMSDLSHFEALHDLGYLPLRIKALPEGSLLNAGVPCFTITNTHPDYQWLPNYLETVLSAEIWKPMTTATIGRTFRNLINQFALETEGNLDNTDYQLHDFSYRGQSGTESSAAVGAGFLLSSKGTDNIPALAFIKHYYKEAYSSTFNAANSVPAGEHSVTTLGIQIEVEDILFKHIVNGLYIPDEEDLLLPAEFGYAEYVLEKFPSGIVSYVADSYDYFGFLDKVLPKLKDKILERDGKFVVRGDSGDPVDIIAGVKLNDYSDVDNLGIAAIDAVYAELRTKEVKAGTMSVLFMYKGKCKKVEAVITLDEYNQLKDVQIGSACNHEMTTQEKGTVHKLWELFGGNVNEMGYKVLDSHIGAIYGDGITEERATETLTRLKDKGFASTNIVFGVGSYTLNMLSRDDLGTAVKATHATVNGNGIDIYKDPKTDSSKKSAKGLLKVVKKDGEYVLHDSVSEGEEKQGCLQTVWLDGDLLREVSFEDVINEMGN